MRVIVCGAGQVGFQIARHLASEGNDVVVIDRSEELVAKISETLDVRGVTGFASHPDVLASADANDADMLIAATYSDEVNMVACQVAHSLFNVPRKIARIRSQEYLRPQWSDLFKRDDMPIDVVISPEIEVARVVVRRLGAPREDSGRMLPFPGPRGNRLMSRPRRSPFQGGGVTVWEGDPEEAFHYEMGPGDMCFLDNYVWHQGNPIFAGERWSLVIFYAVQRSSSNRLLRIIQVRLACAWLHVRVCVHKGWPHTCAHPLWQQAAHEKSQAKSMGDHREGDGLENPGGAPSTGDGGAIPTTSNPDHEELETERRRQQAPDLSSAGFFL